MSNSVEPTAIPIISVEPIASLELLLACSCWIVISTVCVVTVYEYVVFDPVAVKRASERLLTVMTLFPSPLH